MSTIFTSIFQIKISK